MPAQEVRISSQKIAIDQAIMMKLESKQIKRAFGWTKIWFAGVLVLALTVPGWAAFAQTGDETWTDPLNLSHSGIAWNLSFVMDSAGVGHVIWQDDLENFLSTKLDGDEWTAPKATNLNNVFDMSLTTAGTIYTGPNPMFVAGPSEVFAFWLSSQNDLYRSKVKNETFESAATWNGRRLVAPDVSSFAATIDALGELHLVYLRVAESLEQPPGIYYTRSTGSGVTWSKPVLLYESSYLRTLTEGQANLSITTTGTEAPLRVFVAWDNRPRKQVFLAQSIDDGVTWEQSQIAGPTPSSGAAGPFNIRVGANQKSVLVVWQNGFPGGACSQTYQSSADGGETWSDPQSMIQDLSGCALNNEFVTGVANSPDGPLYFLTETKNQVFLTAWDGSGWSQSQAQPMLSGFEEPEIFTAVIFACHRPGFYQGRLYIVGCDQGDGGDVWVTSRELSSLKPPIWSQLSPVTSESLSMEDLQLVTTDDGVFHAFFTQSQDPAVYYTYWDGELWSRRAPIFELPDGAVASPAVATGPKNELFLIASNNMGTLYFSRAESGNAAIESRWSKPAQLEVSHIGQIGSVDIAWNAAGTLYAVYSVPVNEERGIYLVQSTDNGRTWSEPLRVFDGAAAGFDIVGVPSFLVSDDGFVQIVWDQQSIQGNGSPQPLSLFYSRSEDGGRTFSEPQVLVDEPVEWRELTTDNKGNLHLLWQPNGTSTVWDQVSLDHGRTWEYPQGLPDEGSLAGLTKDSIGRLQLVGVGPSALGHWQWDGGRWQAEAPLGWTTSSQQADPVQLLATVVNKQGEMMVVLAMPNNPEDTSQVSLLFSTRTLESIPKQNTSDNKPTPTVKAPTAIPATATLESPSEPTATVEANPTDAQSQDESGVASNPSSPFTMALVPVALLLISVLGIVIWQAARAKDRQ